MSRQMVRIGIWGSQGSGKTTFLAVLSTAAPDQGWALYGSGPNHELATEYLRDISKGLFDPQDRSFPVNTLQPTALEWTLAPNSRGLLRRRRPFTITLWDVPGRWYTDPATRDPAYIEHLAACDGLIYLFDPVKDEEEGIGIRGTTNVLQDLTAHMDDGGPTKGAPLPHFVAVCVTKLDHPTFFRDARRDGWATQDTDERRLPRVKDRHARPFWTWLTQRTEVDFNSARAVQNDLTAFFAKRRIRYFVTSAIGFRLQGPKGSFDPSKDFVNFDDQGASGTGKVFATPTPINVLEPVLALANAIRRRGPQR